MYLSTVSCLGDASCTARLYALCPMRLALVRLLAPPAWVLPRPYRVLCPAGVQLRVIQQPLQHYALFEEAVSQRVGVDLQGVCIIVRRGGVDKRRFDALPLLATSLLVISTPAAVATCRFMRLPGE